MTLLTDLSLNYRLVVPSGDSGGPKPLVITLHGRGSDSNDLASLSPAVNAPPGYRFVFPDAPAAFEPYRGMRYGFTWFDGWPAEKRSIVRSRELLLTFIDEIVAKYPAPSGQIILTGFSQGGLMSLDAGFRTSAALAGIVVMSGALYEEDAPDFSVRPDLPVLIVHGRDDDVIPVLAARRARAVLEEKGVNVEYEEYDMGHFVIPESIAHVRTFIQRCLQGADK